MNGLAPHPRAASGADSGVALGVSRAYGALMTQTPEVADPAILGEAPNFEFTYDPHRDEFNVIVRRPFWLNLRVGATQNALWFGAAVDKMSGRIFTAFNWFPAPWSEYSQTLGRDTRRTLFAQLRDIRQNLDIIRHPDRAPLYEGQSDED